MTGYGYDTTKCHIKDGTLISGFELDSNKIYKYEEGKSESGEETFNYRLIFKKHDGKWYLNYFIIV